MPASTSVATSGDDPAAVEANREAVARGVGVPRDQLVLMNQVHGRDVVEVAGPWAGEAPAVDGIVTRATDLALGVLVADCVPVLLHDAGPASSGPSMPVAPA